MSFRALTASHPFHRPYFYSIEDYYVEDGHHYGPENIYEYMSRLMYQRRSKMNPLWNSFVIAGFRNDKK